VNIGKILVVGLIIVSVLAFVVLPFITEDKESYSGEDLVAVIYLNGTIQESQAGVFSGVISPHLVRSHYPLVNYGLHIRGVTAGVSCIHLH